jgi:hypothetical protein
MRFTTQQELPCPDDTDMAAVALYMQCLAEQVETTLDAQADEFNAFLRVPTAVWQATSTQLIDAGSYINFTTVTSDYWPTTPSPTAPSLPNLRGWYYIGFGTSLTDASPVVDQMLQITLYAAQNVGIVGDPILGRFTDTVWQSNTGGENPLVAGTVFFPGGDFTSPAPVDLSVQFFTQTLASPINTGLVPNPRLFVVYLGDTPEIGVV